MKIPTIKQMKGKYLINNLKRSEKKEGITLVITFSRVLFVPIFFKALENMELPRQDMHLLIYDNTMDPILASALSEECHKLMPEFKSVRLYKSNLKGRGNISGSGNEQFRNSKLYNIWHMWKKVYNMIYTDTFFQLEDDTIAPPNSFPKLYKTLLTDPKIAMVTAIETGRTTAPWLPVGLGVHKLKMQGLFILKRHSFSPDTKGVVEVDGCGVYCFVARTELFKKGFKNYDPEKLNVPFFGLDNILVWNIKRQGYRILADFSLWCMHLEASSSRIIAFGKDQAIELISFWYPPANNYVQGLEVKKKKQKPRRYRVKKHADTWEL